MSAICCRGGLAHYTYHVGQIVFIGKMMKQKEWQSLSIAKGDSQAYNQEKFSAEKNDSILLMSFLKENTVANRSFQCPDQTFVYNG